ncbi:hypothetical protein [uncultured Roseibium sp.]|uniref:hypothetical protein n=1 Tax=uncultured Roseibium sp. TaxID=1936171 RepID=UPI003216B848
MNTTTAGSSGSTRRSVLEVLGIWLAGWLGGGLAGCILFAEFLHRGALMRGLHLPGIAFSPSAGAPSDAFITGIDPSGVLFWGECGLAGGMLVALVHLVLLQRRPVAGWAGSLLAALALGLGIALVINLGGLGLLPLFGGVSGAIYGWFAGMASGRRSRAMAVSALLWFAVSLTALLPLWLYISA